MGDLRNKAKKLAADATHADRWKRERDGWTVFHFDLKPQLTQRNLYIGEAIRHLQRVTATRITFWRCPVRGLAIQYKELPTSHYLGHYGETWTMMRFSRQQDVAPVHPDATPVLLLTEEAREMWMNAPWELAQTLQRPPIAGALRVVTTDTKQGD